MKDATDRNRTSPFAFTGNKFEFRMVGSQDSIAPVERGTQHDRGRGICRGMLTVLEKADDFDMAVHDLIKEICNSSIRESYSTATDIPTSG